MNKINFNEYLLNYATKEGWHVNDSLCKRLVINEEDIINKFKSFANKYLDKYEFIAFSNDGIIMNNLDKTSDNLNCVFVLKLYMCKEKI